MEGSGRAICGKKREAQADPNFLKEVRRDRSLRAKETRKATREACFAGSRRGPARLRPYRETNRGHDEASALTRKPAGKRTDSNIPWDPTGTRRSSDASAGNLRIFGKRLAWIQDSNRPRTNPAPPWGHGRRKWDSGGWWRHQPPLRMGPSGWWEACSALSRSVRIQAVTRPDDFIIAGEARQSIRVQADLPFCAVSRTRAHWRRTGRADRQGPSEKPAALRSDADRRGAQGGTRPDQCDAGCAARWSSTDRRR